MTRQRLAANPVVPDVLRSAVLSGAGPESGAAILADRSKADGGSPEKAHGGEGKESSCLRLAVLAPATDAVRRVLRILAVPGFSLFALPPRDPAGRFQVPAGTDAILVFLPALNDETANLLRGVASPAGPPVVVALERSSPDVELACLRLGVQEVTEVGPLSELPPSAPLPVDPAQLRQAGLRAIHRHRSRPVQAARPERHADMRAVLDLFPLAVALADWTGHLRMLNSKAQVLVAARDAVFVDPSGIIRLLDRAASTVLVETMHALQEGADVDCALSVPRLSGQAALSVLVVPVGRDEEAHATGAALFFAQPEEPLQIAPETLEGLYGLTTAEARLVIALVGGHKLEEAAQLSGTSPHTVRNQLKSAFRKTETNRQAELVKLVLTGPAVFRRRP